MALYKTKLLNFLEKWLTSYCQIKKHLGYYQHNHSLDFKPPLKKSPQKFTENKSD